MERATATYKLKMFGWFALAYFFFYITPNLWPIWTPAELPLLRMELNIPLVPWTFVVYISDYLLALVAIVLIKDKETFHSLTRMCFSTLFICGMFFLFMPTVYPRPIYPTVDNPLVTFAMWLVGTADTPNNCFPSMHVATAGACTWGVRKISKRVFYLFVLWSSAIYLSTLTTKQHYLYDIVGGVIVILLVAWLETKYLANSVVFRWLRVSN